MEYTVKHCPKCNGELHIPSDLKSCICIYCGETFHPQEEETPINPETSLNIETEYQQALTGLYELIENNEQLMKKFTRDSYRTCFLEYTKTSAVVLKPVEQYSLISEANGRKAVEEVTEALLGEVDKNLNRSQGGPKQHQKSYNIDQYRFFLAVYLVPMLTSINLSIGEALAEQVVEEWGRKYPKHAFQKAHYDEIQKGFERKGFCFITTAVCEALGKADDCYELNSFRKFRDEYMLETEEGEELVKEYYQIAPAIVTFINMQQDSKSSYENLWGQYLKPCLRELEENRLEECRNGYVQMLRELKIKFNIS